MPSIPDMAMSVSTASKGVVEQPQRLDTVLCSTDLEAARLENSRRRAAERSLVVDQKNSGTRRFR